jgi:hypothetical protein
MKVEEVPQDKGFLIKGKISDLNYAVDNNGKYTSRQSLGWQPKNEAMSLAWHIVYEKSEHARQLVLDGVLSPIAFYMELNIMDINILSSYTGISKWRVRRHLKMRNFRKLRPEYLEKYAQAFNMTSAELTDCNKIKEIELKHED